jgi:hypothetical protein
MGLLFSFVPLHMKETVLLKDFLLQCYGYVKIMGNNRCPEHLNSMENDLKM